MKKSMYYVFYVWPSNTKYAYLYDITKDFDIASMVKHLDIPQKHKIIKNEIEKNGNNRLNGG